MSEGRVHQLNVSQGGVPKLPVKSAVLGKLGFVTDAVTNKRVHGGPDRAVCIYSLERIEALQAEGHGIFPGAIGENLTLSGLDWDKVVPGVRLAIGGCLVEITKYAVPCSTTSPFVSGDLKRYHQEHYPGWSRAYARVLEGGSVSVGDLVRFER